MKKAPWTRMSGGLKPRSKPAKPKRKGVRRRSRKMERRMVDYRLGLIEFMEQNPVCLACASLAREISRIAGKGPTPLMDLDGILFARHPDCHRKHPSAEIHHRRGRVGPLLTDKRYWSAVCRRAHDFIGRHPEIARKAGLLCEKGQWNTPQP